MSAFRTAVVLLAVALLSSQAAPSGPNCDSLNKTISQEDLHKVNGHWVLVWSVSIGPNSESLLRNLSSSLMVMTLHPDNRTLNFHEKHLHGEVCTTFTTNLTVTSEDNGYKLSTNYAELERNGTVTIDNASEEVRILESCADCLNLKFASEAGGHTVMIYRREGHHRDPEEVKKSYSDYEKLAECLNVSQDLKFTYDGAADFCRKKSPLDWQRDWP